MKKTIIFLLLILIFITPFFGNTFLTPISIFNETTLNDIFFNIRIPRMLNALLSGAILSICGTVFQAIFANPLASPFTLGISSGASLAAFISISFIPFIGNSFITTIPFTFFGALTATSLIYMIAKIKKDFQPETLLLAGIAVNFLVSGTITILQLTASSYDIFKMIHWSMGSTDTLSYTTPVTIFLISLPFIILISLKKEELDILATGEENALSHGLETAKSRKFFLITASALAAAIVSFNGPIAFIGIIAPNAARKLFGANHTNLLLFSAVIGAIILILCDVIGRTLFAPSDIPSGALTSIVGALFFLNIIVRYKKTN